MTTPGAQLAAMRRIATRTCPECGKAFTARATAIYCGAICRRKAWVKSRPPKAKK